MSRRGSPVRLVIALSVAAALAIFLLYTSFAGGATPALKPSQLAGHTGSVLLAGRVVGPVRGDAHAGGLHFKLRDIDGATTVPVVYSGTVPDLFRVDRHVYLKGRLKHQTFVGEKNSLVTKCPSKYTPER